MERNPDIYDTPKRLTNKRLVAIFIVAVVFASLLTIYTYVRRPAPVKKVSPPVITESLYVFVPKDGMLLVQNKLEIKSDMSERQKADEIINELKKQKCVPDRLTLYDFINDDNGVMYLNFSKDILDDKTIGAAREITMTYAIVNSFISNFKNINKVQLLIEGYPAETINGVMHIYKPIEFNKDLLEG